MMDSMKSHGLYRSYTDIYQENSLCVKSFVEENLIITREHMFVTGDATALCYWHGMSSARIEPDHEDAYLCGGQLDVCE